MNSAPPPAHLAVTSETTNASVVLARWLSTADYAFQTALRAFTLTATSVQPATTSAINVLGRFRVNVQAASALLSSTTAIVCWTVPTGSTL